MPGQAGRTEQSAHAGFPDAGPQQPETSGDMVHMGMADKDIADLMGHPCRQAGAIAQVEQQAAALLAQPQMQQGVAENPVDQQREGRPDPDQGPRAGVISRLGIGQDIRRRDKRQAAGTRGRGAAEATVGSALGVPNQQGPGRNWGCRNAQAQGPRLQRQHLP